MLLTPNKLNYGTCPYCKFLLNEWRYVPADAVGNLYHCTAKCPNRNCRKNIGVKVRVTFDVDVIGLEEENEAVSSRES